MREMKRGKRGKRREKGAGKIHLGMMKNSSHKVISHRRKALKMGGNGCQEKKRQPGGFLFFIILALGPFLLLMKHKLMTSFLQ